MSNEISLNVLQTIGAALAIMAALALMVRR